MPRVHSALPGGRIAASEPGLTGLIPAIMSQNLILVKGGVNQLNNLSFSYFHSVRSGSLLCESELLLDKYFRAAFCCMPFKGERRSAKLN